MTYKPTENLAQQEIRALIEHWCAAVRDKDLDAIMSYYAPDIVAFDAIIQLQFKGLQAYREHWRFCLGMSEGPMIFTQSELTVHAEGSLAFAHWLNQCGCTNERGEENSSWMRGSAGYRRTDEGWKAVHEHFSAPFEMESGKALFTLEP